MTDLVERTATLLEQLPEERIAPSLRNNDVTVDVSELLPSYYDHDDTKEYGSVHFEPSAPLINPGWTVNSSFKYNEDRYLTEVKTYIESTYNQHYASKNGSQAIDAIFSAGYGVGFCMGNITKYVSRFGKKQGQNRVDILKLIHYAVLTLHALDLETK